MTIKKIYRIYVDDLPQYCYIGSTAYEIDWVLKRHEDLARYRDRTISETFLYWAVGHKPTIVLLDETSEFSEYAVLQMWRKEFPSCINIPDNWDKYHSIVKKYLT
jgi:hypothetical protein